MKKIFGFVAAAVTFAAAPAVAQETGNSICWADMGDDLGVMDLSDLCGGSTAPVVAPAPSGDSIPAPIPVFATTCSGFATQGEAWYHVYVISSAPQSLDRDGDGQPCESLTDQLRDDGQRVATYLSTVAGFPIEMGVQFVSDDEFYVVIDIGDDQFNTGNFPSRTAAQEHLRTYYGWLQNVDE